jgi:hypothetical protein
MRSPDERLPGRMLCLRCLTISDAISIGLGAADARARPCLWRVADRAPPGADAAGGVQHAACAPNATTTAAALAPRE